MNKKDRNLSIQAAKLGIFFFLLFSAYMSFQNIVTHVYHEKGLTAVGPLNLIFNYLSFLISNTLAVNCKLSFKTQLIIGSLAYSVNMCTGIFVPYIQNTFFIYFIVSFGGLVGGISAGFLWVSQGGYLRQVCKGQVNKGKYTAIFTFLLSSSQLMAGFTATFFLGFFSDQVYFIALTTISLSSALFGFIFLDKISQKEKENQKYSFQEQDIKKNIIQSLKFYKIMIPYLIILIMDGLCLGIQSNQMSKLIPKNQTKDQDLNFKVGVLTIFIGAGSLISSSLNGIICDKLGLKIAGRITMLFYLITCILTYFGSIILSAYWLACIISFIWGFTYYLFEGWIYVSILKLFSGKLQAFAINKQVHCISMASFQVFVIITNNDFNIQYLMLAIVLLVIPGYYCMMNVNYQKQNQKNVQQNNNQKKQDQNSLIKQNLQTLLSSQQ